MDESSIKRLCITYRIIVNSLVRFLLKYWIVLSVFLLTGIILGKIDFNIPVFFRSILGLSNEYNNEWWYVKQYIKMLIMLPFIDYVYVFVRKCIKDKKYFVPAVVCGGVLAALCIPESNYIISIIVRHIGMFSFVMMSGYVFAKARLHNHLYLLFEKAKFLPFLIIALTVALRIIVSPEPLDTQIDWLIAPMFVISVSYVIRLCPEFVKWILSSFGKYSMFIWLTHTFFIYYYFQSVMMAPRELLLIYLALLAVCVGIGIIFDRIYNCLLSFYDKSWLGRFLIVSRIHNELV